MQKSPVDPTCPGLSWACPEPVLGLSLALPEPNAKLGNSTRVKPNPPSHKAAAEDEVFI